MKLMNKEMKYNLQFFAEKGEDGDDDDNSGIGDDDQDETIEQSEKKFTQADIDDAISKRLKREREKQKKKVDTSNNSDDEKKQTDDSTNEKVTSLEAKLLCFENDVTKDSVADVVALAKAYMNEDTDFEDAIKKVIAKYPQFVKDSKNDDETEKQNSSWGNRQKQPAKKISGVEEAFLKRNPSLKLD